MPGGRPRTQTQPGGAKSVTKVLDILEHLGAAKAPAGVSDIARATGFNVSTAYRLLQTLAERGYVEQRGSDRSYVLGPRVFQLGNAYLQGSDLAALARPHLAALRDEVGETVYLTILRQGQNVPLCKADGQQVVSASVSSVEREPAFCTANGKVLLAGLAPAELAHYVAGLQFESYTPQTINTKARLLRELDTVRAQGYALDLEEFAKDLCCVSVPLRRPDGGAVVAAISVAMPKLRFKPAAVPRWVKLLQAKAQLIAQQLGVAA